MDTQPLCRRCGKPLPPDAPEGLCPACLADVGLGTEHGEQRPPPGGSSSSSQPAPPSIQDIARHFSHLEILEILGQGGMGVVYKARQIKLDRLVALKILPLEAAKDPNFAERFAREARTLARLNHPNIVAIFDFGESDGLFYFLMEYVDGVNLRQMENVQRLAPEQALDLVPKICDALQYAHEEGIVHRDIKPGNILIDTKGRVKIADFGLAKLLGKPTADLSLTGSRHVMGTPHYMAPEQMERPQTVDHRADIYSLGVVFYEMLTGELPVGRFAPPSRKVQVDVRLDDVVLRTLEKEPHLRYQQASDVRTDVETIHHGPIPSHSRSLGPPPHIPGSEPHLAAAREKVKIPSIGLLVCAFANLALILLPGVAGALGAMTPLLPMHHPVSFFSGSDPTAIFLPQLILSLGAAIGTIIGAQALQRLTSYSWAMAGAILAVLPLGGLWLVTAAFGAWALIIMHQPDVRTAFANPNLASPATLPSPTPPLSHHESAILIPAVSGKAIVGACLVALSALIVIPLLLRWVVPRIGFGEVAPMIHTTHTAFLPMFFLVFSPFGLICPLAATILGTLAIKDIRYSQGRLVGLPLALFDALCFPLIFLDLGIFGFWMLAVKLLRSLHYPPDFVATPRAEILLFLLILSAAVLSVVLTNGAIIRAAWQAAKKPTPNQAHPATSPRI